MLIRTPGFPGTGIGLLHLKHVSFRSLLFLLSISACTSTNAQEDTVPPIHKVFLAGNLTALNNSGNLERLKEVIRQQTTPTTLIYCGDLLRKDLSDRQPDSNDSLDIRSLLDVAEGTTVNIFFIPGDMDWDHSGKKGWKHVKILEKLVNGMAGKNVFLPGSGCPGPEILNVDSQLEIVLLNTPWLIHPYDKPYEPDDDCSAMEEDQFFEMLEDAVEEAKDKHLLVVGHHPALSNGYYGGWIPFREYFSPPLIGIFQAGYHQNIGSPEDMAFPPYRRFSERMKNLMLESAAFIYASAHEYNLQVLRHGNSCQVISGSLVKKMPAHESRNTVYESDRNGFIALSYFPDGKVVMNSYELHRQKVTMDSIGLFQPACGDSAAGPVNNRMAPCPGIVSQAGVEEKKSTGKAIAGKQYRGRILKKIMLGKLYRSSWTAEVEVPFLDLDSTAGGLQATGIGGGRQTHSLSFKGGDGKSYVFRSVDKDPVHALDPKLRKTFVAGLTRQFTATQHPYGALPVSELLNSTNILHASPRLYILPDTRRLGIFQKEFGGMLGMLEEKPSKKKQDSTGTFESNEIIRSHALIRKLFKDHDNRVDEKAFLEARIFDMWIGDWGRHEDNWKWAGYASGDRQVTYKPVPRDRDHAFSIWNGLLPYLVSRRWALPNAESFKRHFGDLVSLNYPARHLDRFLLSSMTKQDWQEISSSLAGVMTDSVIDNAITQFPKEMPPVTVREIGKKLKSRRDELVEASLAYYDVLSKRVNIVGSNKAEYFYIRLLPGDSVSLNIYDIDKTRHATDLKFYDRTFSANETRLLNVYGLDGDDVFLIEGDAPVSIRITVFGGKGDDTLSNLTTGSRNRIRIGEYKSGQDNFIKAGNARVILSDERRNVEYNRKPVHYNSYLPLPLLYYTAEDGFSAGLGLLYVFHRYGEEGYVNKLRIYDRFSTEGTVHAKITDEFHHLLSDWDVLLSAEAGQPYPPVYFYGAGNNSVKPENVPKEKYLSEISGYSFMAGLQRIFWQKSNVSAGIHYEYNEARLLSENLPDRDSSVFGLKPLDYFGPHASVDLDFLDNAFIPKYGIRLYAGQVFSHFNISDKKDYGNTKVILELYQTARFRFPVTLGLKGTFSNNTGDVPFYKINTLGRTSGLRGYSRDRFSGKTAASLNSQLSLELGTLQTVLAPLTFGIYTFGDFGRVWEPGETSNVIHNGYGTGIYFTPVFEILTTHISVSFSKESKNGMFEAGLGTRF